MKAPARTAAGHHPQRPDGEPWVRRRADQRQRQYQQRRPGKNCTPGIEAARGGVAGLADREQGHGAAEKAERHVDPEHRRPVEAVDQEATEHRAGAEPEAAHRRPQADRSGRPLAGKRGDQDRQRQRAHRGCANALGRPQRNQLRVVG
jgi:hypothetical protein